MTQGYIDFHAHILPRADHGSDGMETSLIQLELAEKAGIGVIVATPHFYPDMHTAHLFFKRRSEALSELKPFLRNLTVIQGAEVTLCEGLDDLPELEMFRIGESRSILIEMPAPPWNRALIDSLLRMKQLRGLDAILAHVDRYDPNWVEELFGLGFFGQLNASALIPITSRRRFDKWIDGGFIKALGSDAHGVSHAFGDYSRAVRILGERAERLQKSMYDLVFECPVNDSEGSA